ncbi:MAG TPA: ABC transporter permease [Streptosporangiaceae bacterium]|nr:ABC transporter permease [Streptosporangiaceae bacterium]
MSTSVLTPASSGLRVPEQPARRRRPKVRFGDRLLHVYTWLLIGWLALPIAAVALFSFNNPKGRLNILWVGFTLKWWGPKLFEYPDLTRAMWNSITIGVIATVASTVLGTLIGLALGKHKFRGQNVTNLLQFAAISAPEIVLGSSLLTFFLTLGVQPGYPTIVIAHIAFCLSFVAVTVRARALTLDPFIEEAARDLGAGPWATFRLVTLPLIWPGVMSGALLAFALSIDDFITTNFVAGSVQTYPLYIWGASREGLPPQVNVMGTIIFMFGAGLAIFNSVRARRARA